MFFTGQYRHTLDSKDRLTVPARFRELLEGGAYVMQGFDQNLIVFTEPAFVAIHRRISQMKFTDPLTRLLRRLIFSTASRVDMDKVGRILIPEFLRKIAELDGDVMLVGAGDYFEIWSVAHWEQQLILMHDTEANAHRFETLDLFTSTEEVPG
jgi:MraZ protein